MSNKVLVAYASVSGSTGEVAEAIGLVLSSAGATVEVRSVTDVLEVRDYGAIVLGSSIRAGRWLPEASQFLQTFQEAMSQMVVAYFTTCLILADDTADNRRTVLAYMEPILQQAPQIEPVGLGLFAGALDPHRLALPMLHSDLAPQGDYRNWAAIRAWAVEICPHLLVGTEPAADAAELSGAILCYSDMSGANLSRADLHQANLYQADLSEANLKGANLSQTYLVGADLHQTDLDDASLHQAGLNWADLNRASLSGADLSRANLLGADLNRANLRQANLSQAILNGANLSQADLHQANLSGSDLNWANLSEANLSEANLSGANLGWANLKGANLDQVNLHQAQYNYQTEWPEGFSAQARGAIPVGF